MSEETCKTVRVKSPISVDNESGFIIINESDFDADVHELFDETPKAAEAAPAWKPK